MDVIAALRRERAQLEKRVEEAQAHLDRINRALDSLGGIDGIKTKRRGRRKGYKLSKATRDRMAAARKKYWANRKRKKTEE